VSIVELTGADNDKYFEVRTGDTIIVRLYENRTTGFHWTAMKGAENIITLVSSDFTLFPSSGVGGGGQRVMAFEAKKSGSDRLRIKLWREWEGEESVKNHFDIAITVRN
jgi:inhibitor of cysteine peptidase